MLTNRRSLWWLLGPVVVYLGVLPLVNRVEPVVLGLPFMMFWMLVATLLSPVFVWLAAKGDPVWAAARQAERDQAGKARASSARDGGGHSGGGPDSNGQVAGAERA